MSATITDRPDTPKTINLQQIIIHRKPANESESSELRCNSKTSPATVSHTQNPKPSTSADEDLNSHISIVKPLEQL